jgi:hypothetical protein
VKECDYCGRKNEDDAVYCRECGTQEFKGDPPQEPVRVSLGELINNCATTLDELASSREMLLSWMMAGWIVLACEYLLRRNFSPTPYAFGMQMRWWEDVAAPLFVGVTFIIAPIIGVWSLARWLRQGQKRVILNLAAWMLLSLFVAIFCLVWIVFWDSNPGAWFR